MNLDRYEKIDGREALKLLLDGKTVLNSFNETHLLDGARLVFIRKSGAYETVNDGLKQILETTWYIPKPFDVRQAMLERPNEWVAAFEVAENWYKIGFDTTFMQMACASISSEISVDLSEDRVFEVQLSNLINCIPIEDVPEEATW